MGSGQDIKCIMLHFIYFLFFSPIKATLQSADMVMPMTSVFRMCRRNKALLYRKKDKC